MSTEQAKQILKTLKMLETQGIHSLNELRVIIGLERAIARLSNDSVLADHLVFKGGFVLLKNFDSDRFTRDADALAVDISKDRLTVLVSNALATDLDDGLWFGDVKVESLEEQGEYGAFRFDCAFQIGEPDLKKIRKLSRIHVDVGLSDKLPTRPKSQIMPSLLDDAEPVSWRVYPIEFIVAEKLETLIVRGAANSRAKDVYDLVMLIPKCKGPKKLQEAISTTFSHRGTPLPGSFPDAIKSIDTTILKGAWGGIQVADGKMGFDGAWEQLADLLEKELKKS
jgi:predicted nucleotidyltransferase component of viral defense system